jgi:hypothetical protein
LSLDESRVFLKASEAVHFESEKKEEVCAWVSGCLGGQNWDQLGRTARGLVRRYLEKMTGLNQAQTMRLITRTGGMRGAGLSRRRSPPRSIDRLVDREKRVRGLRQNRNPRVHPLLCRSSIRCG